LCLSVLLRPQMGSVPGDVVACAAVLSLWVHERAIGTARSVRADWLVQQRCDGDGMGRGQCRDWCGRLLAAAGGRVWAQCSE
jgi:hypothetical protein